MCGFLISDKTYDTKANSFKYLNSRGPDSLNHLNKSNINFYHTLLSLTGEFTNQPIVDDSVIVTFNGEIYNYKDFGDLPSDGYAILEAYKIHGEDFINYLDGEFSIVIYDDTNKKIVFATDIFATKPFYYTLEGESFSFSSYKETIQDLGFKEVKKLHANSLGIFDLNSKKLTIKNPYFKFDLNQHKNSFKDWESAFLKSIEKRFKNIDSEIVLPLSSGMDSGSIACAFNKLGIKSTIFSFYGNEHKIILLRRLIIEMKRKNKIYIKRYLTQRTTKRLVEDMYKRIPHFKYGVSQNEKDLVVDGFNDRGSKGLMYLLDKVKSNNKNIKILASGQGGDEVYSNLQNYSFGNIQNPKIFGDNISDIFPWENFYESSQASYLIRNESISGGFGIEGRYPLLDKQVVQEYLWLKPELKNDSFKSPLSYFLINNNYPIKTGDPEEINRGFNVINTSRTNKFIGLFKLNLKKLIVNKK